MLFERFVALVCSCFVFVNFPGEKLMVLAWTPRVEGQYGKLLPKSIPDSAKTKPMSLVSRPLNGRLYSKVSGDDNDKNEVSSFDMKELKLRMESVAKSDQQLKQSESDYVQLPVICFDSLLPNQTLEGRTTDATFSRFLQQQSVGGLFVMVSLDFKQRKIRRNGVICQIVSQDVPHNLPNPTATDFVVKGKRRCRVIGPSKDMSARIGRWRRSYDPDGEESVLGWGNERFVDALYVGEEKSKADDQKLEVPTSCTEWSLNLVDCSITSLADEDTTDEETMALAEKIKILLEEWVERASDVKTYDNVDVVATTRIRKGHPGLRVDPAALLRNVANELSERPSDPTELAIWGAALINPLPCLGVSPEIRGQILEAPNAKERLKILEWGVKKSLNNLKGKGL